MKSVGSGLGLVAIFSLYVGHASGACRMLRSVPINEKFLKKAPAGGWYSPLSKGSKLEHFSPKPDPPIKGASKKICWQAPIMYNGQAMSNGGYECSYVPGRISEQHCELADKSAALALQTLHIPVPATFRLSIVDTDNKTFIVWAACGDGGSFTWQVLSRPKARISESRVHRALGITKADGEESKKNKIKLGRTEIKDGPCEKGITSAISDVGAELQHQLEGAATFDE